MHERYLKLWAKKVIVSPESAVVPIKEVDYQLASKFEVRKGRPGGASLWGGSMVNFTFSSEVLLGGL